MAVVTEAEKQILLQMGFAEFIIPAMSQVTAQMAIDEFHNTGVPPGLTPGQLGTTAGGGIVEQFQAATEGFTEVLGERVEALGSFAQGPGLLIVAAVGILALVILLK